MWNRPYTWEGLHFLEMVNLITKIWNKVNRKIEKFANCARIETRKIKRKKKCILVIINFTIYCSWKSAPNHRNSSKTKKGTIFEPNTASFLAPQKTYNLYQKVNDFYPCILRSNNNVPPFEGHDFLICRWTWEGSSVLRPIRSNPQAEDQCCYLHLRTLPNLEPKAGSFHPSPSWPPGLSACAQS